MGVCGKKTFFLRGQQEKAAQICTVLSLKAFGVEKKSVTVQLRIREIEVGVRA